MLSLAARNFTRNLRRYRILVVALTLAVASLVVLVGLLEGVHTAVREKASRYFAGDITLQVFRGGGAVNFPDADAVLELVTAESLPLKNVVARSIYTRLDATLFFAGAHVDQRRLAGVDWEAEQSSLGQMQFVSGGLPSADTETSHAALISTAVAERLGARVGDELILSLFTRRNQRNTVPLVISGIYHEHSFFGYTVYMDRATLNTAQQYPPNAVRELGLHLGSYRDIDWVAQTLHQAFEQAGEDGFELRVFPVWSTRDERSASLAAHPGGNLALGIMPLYAQLDEITDLLDAMQLIGGAAILAFLLIVVVGVTNTYTMITYERTREIGTLRALGLSRMGTTRLLITEALVMSGCAVALGLPAGFALLELAHRTIDLSGNAFAVLFLVQGRIQYTVPLLWLPGIFGAVAAAAVLGCMRPAVRAALLPPAGALQQE